MLARTVEALGAYAGALFLLEPGGEVLTLDVSAGMPFDFAGPLRRVRMGAEGGPIAEALHERRQIWMESGQEIARRYPMLAMVLPHPRAVAVTPLETGSTAWGALLTLFPETTPGPDAPARHLPTTAAQCIAWVMQGAAGAGHPLYPGPQPRFVAPPSRERALPSQAQAAVDFLAAVPEGCCRLSPRARITFVDPTAAALLDADVPDLLGARLWEAVPWLADPQLEFRHQAAVISRLPSSYTALDPFGEPLLFTFYPDRRGVSVRITPRAGRQNLDRPALPRDETTGGGERLDALRHRMHLSGALAEARSVRQVVELVADHLLLALQAQTFGLLVAEEGRVRLIGHRGASPAMVELFDGAPFVTDLPAAALIPQTPARELARGVPSFFANREEIRAAYPEGAAAADGVAASAWLPLVVSGQLVGLCMVGYTEPHPFTLEERAVCTSLGTLIAQALDRARQYDVTHQLAEGLQESLLPRALKAVPGLEATARYLPASRRMDVGGDFYDVVRLSSGEAAAVIGDVEGHNVSAAGLMGQARTAVHAYAVSGAPPDDVLRGTNRLLIDLDTELLTSCLYVHLDLVRHVARVASAGHWPPLLHHPGRPAEMVDLQAGPLLGVDADAEYPVTEIGLRPGSTLALYTDGLIEMPGTDQDTTIAGLNDVLADGNRPLDVLADALVTRAQPTGHRADDTALLLVKLSSPDGAHPDGSHPSPHGSRPGLGGSHPDPGGSAIG
ncbi:SpoIIE family protein phosphatase [Actinacidiphila acidipaludis]|uniref:SpoIIE family protein phosphatase n=1 Tax=Actinacidiphila acidipaludis TaxID=2873382 RepID=A0ABS7PYX8_9ACTN|nr:SpoIIE family protein phosphatase [Streptomyces acidipaludis]MBY8876099.1 SpoIIE family protein phosphatase [Streptomyces acidipaludis]